MPQRVAGSRVCGRRNKLWKAHSLFTDLLSTYVCQALQLKHKKSLPSRNRWLSNLGCQWGPARPQ